MIIQLDAGNTRVKWRALSGREVVFSGAANIEDVVDVLIGRVWPASEVDQIQFASVADQVRNKIVIARLVKEFSAAELIVAKTGKTMAGLTVAYAEPEALGIDRALAMIGARLHAKQVGFEGALLVIDAGSALTADWLDTKGAHKGGYITCGYGMMNAALNQNTGRIDVVGVAGVNVAPGDSTAACVGAGVAHTFGSAISNWVCEAQALGARVYLTGGDAGFVQTLLPSSQLVVMPDLVLEGLGEYVAYRGEGQL